MGIWIHHTSTVALSRWNRFADFGMYNAPLKQSNAEITAVKDNWCLCVRIWECDSCDSLVNQTWWLDWLCEWSRRHWSEFVLSVCPRPSRAVVSPLCRPPWHEGPWPDAASSTVRICGAAGRSDLWRPPRDVLCIYICLTGTQHNTRWVRMGVYALVLGLRSCLSTWPWSFVVLGVWSLSIVCHVWNCLTRRPYLARFS